MANTFEFVFSISMKAVSMQYKGEIFTSKRRVIDKTSQAAETNLYLSLDKLGLLDRCTKIELLTVAKIYDWGTGMPMNCQEF